MRLAGHAMELSEMDEVRQILAKLGNGLGRISRLLKKRCNISFI